MSVDATFADAASPRSPEVLASLKNVAQAVYALQALSFLWGVTAIVAVVVSYVKREDFRGTPYESHCEWQIRTFWWGLLWLALGVATAMVFVGFIILYASWVWMIYRVVKGWLKLHEGKPVEPSRGVG